MSTNDYLEAGKNFKGTWSYRQEEGILFQLIVFPYRYSLLGTGS